MSETPVALFIYHRPELTRRVLDAVRQARPARLLVVADGPSAGNPDDERLCREAREALVKVDWPCRVETHFASTNLGLRRRFSTGLDWVFSTVPEAIILEDDCIPDASFFPFCTELLARYREDDRVHMIRGGNFLRGRRYSRSSYYFSRFFHIWGWATWARAWRHYDVDMRRWPEYRDSGWLERMLPNERMVTQMRTIFDWTHSGYWSTWEFQWAFCGWLRNAVALSPWSNMVQNVGFGPGASSTWDPLHPYAWHKRKPTAFPLSHPPAVNVMEKADLREFEQTFPDMRGLKNLPMRVERRLRRLFYRQPA